MRRRWFAFVLLAVLLIPSVAGPTGTLVIPQTIAALSAGNQPASLLDQNWTAIQTYINNREVTIGLAAARLAAGTSGRYFFATDTAGGTLYVDTGSAWQQLAPSLTSTLAETLAGLTLSNNASNPSTTFAVAVGAASSDDAAIGSRVLMTLTSAFTKTTAAWAVGTGNGCLDTGSVAAGSWYHVFLIQRTDTGVVDLLCSGTLGAPLMPTNYTKKRWIGSVFTDGGSALNFFTQYLDEFMWATVPTLNVGSTNPGTAANTNTATVPPGVSVQAILNVSVNNVTTNNVTLYLSALDAADMAANAVASPLGSIISGPAGANAMTGAQARGWTNTTQSYRWRLSASGAADTIRIATLGWKMPRHP